MTSPSLSYDDKRTGIFYRRTDTTWAMTAVKRSSRQFELDAYADIIHDPEIKFGTVVILVTNATASRFQWLPPHCFEIRIAFCLGTLATHSATLRIQDRAGNVTNHGGIDLESPRLRMMMHLFDDKEIKQVVRTVLIVENAIHLSIGRNKLADVVSTPRDATSCVVGCFYVCGYFVRVAQKSGICGYSEFCVLTLPCADAEAVYRNLTTSVAGTVKLLPPDQCLDLPGKGADFNYIYPDPRKVAIKWHGMASLRPPRTHAYIVDLVLVLHNYGLGAYVILEIYDWLQEEEIVHHRKKIALIYAVQKSIRSAIGVRDFRFENAPDVH